MKSFAARVDIENGESGNPWAEMKGTKTARNENH